MTSPRRRLFVLLAVGAAPWTVLFGGGEVTLVHTFGFVNANPLSVTHLYEYLFVLTDGLPRRLQAWPASVLLYALALASAVGGLRGLEDPRLTTGALVFAGVAHAQVAYGFHRLGLTVLPIGPALVWFVAWWLYRPLVGERTPPD